MIFLLLFVFLCGCLNHAGSLVLTSSPLTATDGELFTLICSSNTTTGGQDRQWSRDGTSPVLTTTQSSPSLIVVTPYAFNRYLSGRVNVSCNATQHNVTLRINSAVDNGSRWQCVDNPSSQRSNTMTINVTADGTTAVTTTTQAASVTTSSATDVASTGSIDDNVTETPSFSTSDYLNTSATIFTTNNNTKETANANPTSCSAVYANQIPNQSNTVAIVAGAAGGGVAVIAVVIVAAVCIRKRRRSVEGGVRDKSRRDRNPSRSAEMLIESGVTGGDEKVMMDNIIDTSSSEVVPAEYSIQGHNQDDKVMQDNILYTSSSDIASADYSTEDPNRVVKDVYTQVKKVKTNADHHEVTDMYAKPHKGRKETPNGDVYAKVNKEKSREGTSENMEDMYAKPQKDKRNPKRNPDAE